MKPKPLRAGIIGCGLMGSIHAECYARHPDCEITGFTNPTRSKAEALAARFGGQVYDSPQALLESGATDAVSIASPQQAHAEQVIAAAQAGQQILCEKPLGLAPVEFDAMQAAVREAGVVVMVGHQLRFHPVMAWVKEQQPRLGRVFHLELEMSLLIQGHAGRCWMDFHSGGFFMELGCHLADLARHLLGEVRHATALTARLNPRRITEDFTHCLLQFESGAIASIVVSANHRSKRQGLLRGRLLGEKGRLEWTIYPYSRALNSARIVFDKGKSTFVPDAAIETMASPRPPSLTKGNLEKPT